MEENRKRKSKKGKLQKKENHKKRKASFSPEAEETKNVVQASKEPFMVQESIPKIIISIPKEENEAKNTEEKDMSTFKEKLKLKGLGLKVSLGNSSAITNDCISKSTLSKNLKSTGQLCTEIGSCNQYLSPCPDVIKGFNFCSMGKIICGQETLTVTSMPVTIIS